MYSFKKLAFFVVMLGPTFAVTIPKSKHYSSQTFGMVIMIKLMHCFIQLEHKQTLFFKIKDSPICDFVTVNTGNSITVFIIVY